jgi:citrate lyase subunit beta/citryl-CoA lyase
VNALRPDARTARSQRSLLFVPAHSERYVASAATAGADAVVLDLEDSVPGTHKDPARAALAAARATLAASTDVRVRVNSSNDSCRPDLAACASAGIASIVIPKVDSYQDMERVHRLLDELEYRPEVGILIESCRGVLNLREILDAAGPLQSVALGAEDLRQELEPFAPDDQTSPTLLWAHSTLVAAATAAGVTAIGLIGSIAEFSQLDVLGQGAAAAWRMGYRGSYCIHPRQVPVLNAAYSPSKHDVAWAIEVTGTAATKSEIGQGAFSVDGRMVDAPLVARAERILELHRNRSAE